MQILWQACWELLRLEYFVLRKDFRRIHERVRTAPLRNPRPGETVTKTGSVMPLM
jgi:hypothetical protein